LSTSVPPLKPPDRNSSSLSSDCTAGVEQQHRTKLGAPTCAAALAHVRAADQSCRAGNPAASP
jgi:hypothetical protein